MDDQLKRRGEGEDEQGFTLIELLVVILIIGILAAITIPSFLNQKSKGSDASAKELVRTAQTITQTIGVDNRGSYATVSPAALNATEPSIVTTAGNNAWLSAASGTSTDYVLSTTSASTNTTFTITNTSGVVVRTCSAPGKGGCSPAGDW